MKNGEIWSSGTLRRVETPTTTTVDDTLDASPIVEDPVVANPAVGTPRQFSSTETGERLVAAIGSDDPAEWWNVIEDLGDLADDPLLLRHLQSLIAENPANDHQYRAHLRLGLSQEFNAIAEAAPHAIRRQVLELESLLEAGDSRILDFYRQFPLPSLQRLLSESFLAGGDDTHISEDAVLVAAALANFPADRVSELLEVLTNPVESILEWGSRLATFGETVLGVLDVLSAFRGMAQLLQVVQSTIAVGHDVVTLRFARMSAVYQETGPINELWADYLADVREHQLDSMLLRELMLFGEIANAGTLERETVAEIASAFQSMANVLSDMPANRHDATELAVRGCALLKGLARVDPDVFTPNLAGSLNNLAAMYSNVGRRDDALTTAIEAAALYRGLARVYPDTFTPNLAMSLNNLANRYSDVGRREDALTTAIEALTLRRELARIHPDTFTPNLATSLNTLAAMYSDVGRREDALTTAIEAAALRRELARVHPDTFTPDLAGSLNNLATMYSDVGRREDALTTAIEAAALYRELARVHPDTFTPNLAMSLNNLANRYSEVGRREDALTTAIEAAALYRGLARIHPDTFTPDLAGSLNNLANVYSDVGRRDDALTTAIEAAALYRGLARVHPDTFTPDLAMSLNNLANRFAEVERIGEAVVARTEAVQVEANARDLGLDVQVSQFGTMVGRIESRIAQSAHMEDLRSAIELLEGARVTALGNAINRRPAGLLAAPLRLQRRYELALEELRSTAKRRRGVFEASARFQAARAEVRNVPGLERFGEQPTVSDLLLVLGPKSAGVVMFQGSDRTFAVVMTSTDVHAAVELSVPQGVEHDPSDLRHLRAVIAPYLGEFLGPVRGVIGPQVEELVVIACGRLSQVPWQIARFDDGSYLADRYAIRFAPSLTSLVQMGVRTSGFGSAVLAPYARNGDDVARRLSGTLAEAQVAAALARVTVLDGPLTAEKALEAIERASSVHLATHGVPHKLLLNGSVLETDAIGVSPRQRGEALVTACYSSVPSELLPDEQEGIPTVFLGAGFQRVLSCAWAVDDVSTALLSMRYQLSRHDEPELLPAIALQQAQKWLRRLTRRSAEEWVRSVADRFDSDGVAVDGIHDLADRLAAASIEGDPDGTSVHLFDDPFHWGGLILTGQ